MAYTTHQNYWNNFQSKLSHWSRDVVTRLFRTLLRYAPNEAFQQLKVLGRLTASPEFMLLRKIWENSKETVMVVMLATAIANILALAFPLTLLQVYDRIIPNEATETLAILLIVVIAALSFELILKLLRSHLSAWTDGKFEHTLSYLLFKKIMRAKLTAIEEEGSGSFLERINAAQSFKELYLGQLVITLIDIPFLLLYLGLVAYIGGYLVLIPLFVILTMIFFSLRLGKNVEQILKERRAQDDRRLNFIIEALEKIHTLKSLAMEAQILRRYERLQTGNTLNNYIFCMESNKTSVLLLTASQLTMILLVGFGSIPVMNHTITMGGLVACTIISGRCVNPVNQIIGLWTRLKTMQVSQNKVIELLSLEKETATEKPPFPPIKGDIHFENISFRSSLFSRRLQHIDFKIKANEMIGLSGADSKGKTHLLRILMGIDEPEGGRVLIDGKDIQEYNLYTLRSQISYLPNNIKMFNGTLLDNLTLFQKENYEMAMRLTRNLGLSEQIEHLPKGFDTQVGKNSTDLLPRGTLQLISIARALIRRPRIILFDQANTELDQRADKLLREVFEKIKGQYTIIAISYRPSFLKIADRIYQLNDDGLKPYERK